MFFLIRILLIFIISNICFAGQLDDQLQASVTQLRKYYQLPSLSISVQLPSEKNPRNFVSGYYSLSSKKPINDETLFQVGSITKTFTAVLILQLAEEGRLNLEDSITKFLPEYSHWRNIKIKNLLDHTSGLYNYTHGKVFDEKLRSTPNKIWTMQELVNIAYQHPNQALPNKKYLYTNTDYLLLGMIIEKITHKNLDKVFAEFLKKHQLTHTYYAASGFPGFLKDKIAHGYNQDGTFPYNADVTDVSISFSKSAGGLVSTPADINKFIQELFTGELLSKNYLKNMLTILSSKSLQVVDVDHLKLPHRLINNTFAETGVGNGIGMIYLNGLGYFYVHSGGMPGYEALYLYDPLKNIYLTLAYGLKPKKDFIDIMIAQKLLQDIYRKD